MKAIVWILTTCFASIGLFGVYGMLFCELNNACEETRKLAKKAFNCAVVAFILLVIYTFL